MNKPSHRRSLRQSIHLYALGAAAVVVAYLAISQIGTSTSSARTESEAVSAEYGVVQTTATGTGSVEAGVDDDVDFATSGTLSHVYVKVGEYVSKGETLARLDPSSAELTLAQARLSLEEAKVALTDAEDGDATASTGDSSSTDGTTADTDEDVDSGSTDYVSDELADTTTTTTKTVTVSAKTRPTISSKTSTSTSTSTSSSPSAPSKSTDETTSATSSSTSTTVSATTIDSDKLTVESDEQTVKSDEEAVDETALRAPVSGTIASLEYTSPGEAVSSSSSSSSSSDTSSDTTTSSSDATTAGSLGASSSSDDDSSDSGFAEIVNTNTLTMTVPFSESDISEIKVGQSATVTLDALTGVELAAKVTSISPTATESDDVVSYDATLTIDQTDSKVRPGMSASASVIIDQADGVTVPTEAVSGSGSTDTVTLDENGKHVTQQVIVGLRGSTRDEIASGLKAGQQVIVTETLPSLGTSTSTTSSSGTTKATGTFGEGTGAATFGGGAGFRGTGGGPPGGAP